MAEQEASALLGSEVREGYADIGDVRLHYVEAGEGPLVVLLHGFPEFWYGWRLQIKPLAAAGFRVVAPDIARLQPVVTAEGRQGLRDRQADRRHPRAHPRMRRQVRAAGRSRLGRKRCLGHRDELSRSRGPAGYPQCGPSAEALAGTAPPELRKSWYFFFFNLPDLPESVAATLALLPALLARRPPEPIRRRRSITTSRRGHSPAQPNQG